MAFQAQTDGGTPVMVDYTPGSAVGAGEVVVEGATPFIAHRDIEAGRPGALAVGGGVYICDVAAQTNMGVTLWWDDTSNRVTTASAGNRHFGKSVSASFDSDSRIKVLHEPQGVTGPIV